MRAFDYERELSRLMTPEVVNALSSIHALRARQELRRELRPVELEGLREIARIQSTGASNSLENIRTSDARLRELVQMRVQPKNRDEREIAGYRAVLDLIHESYEHIDVTPNVILQLHRDLYRYVGVSFGGRWKDADNVIAETGADGALVTRFVPTSVLETPDAVESLCAAYVRAVSDGRYDALLACALFTFDFVSIHPFNDGNGRMSRLLMLLTLYRAGYDVGRYVSLEHEIERTKETYYEALAASSCGWHEGKNDCLPYVTYFLGVVLACYRDLDERVAMLSQGTPEECVRSFLSSRLEPVSRREIAEALPAISSRTLDRVLARLQVTGRLEKVGAARATRYRWVR